MLFNTRVNFIWFPLSCSSFACPVVLSSAGCADCSDSNSSGVAPLARSERPDELLVN
jgi:hypothetical protein